MKKLTRVFELILTIAFVVLATSVTPGQNRERFGISAKAGGVNAVVGQVTVNRTGQAPAALTNSDDIAAGDTVTTGSQSYVEVLLNPGSYFRARENSEFQFEDSTLDHLRLKLVKGSAIVEATGMNDMDLNIRVITAQAVFTIMRSGVYRIDAQPDFAQLSVRKGRAAFGPNKADVVKGGNKATFRNGQIARAKFSKAEKDDFDLWSNQRAELLARANEKLSARTFGGYVASLSSWDLRSMGSGWGIWAFNPRAGFYTFMPFTYGWSSPYGHHYGNYCYYPHWRGGNWSGSGTNGGGGWGGSSGGSVGGGSSGGSSSGGSSGGRSSSPPPSQPEPRTPRDMSPPSEIHRDRQP
jgi:uncharacterized membrane protein YgcG